ncbi:MAG: cysteine desulfurase family protein [Bacilli bacterium]
MIYLDYCATTPVNKKVLNCFIRDCIKFPYNANSSHKLGLQAKSMIDVSTNNIARILGVKPQEIIYTSGSTEANNLAIKGSVKIKKGKHVITTILEHSSVIAPLNRLSNDGYEVDFVNLTKDGLIDINHLKSLLRKDTVLLSVVGVDSELGIRENVEEIGILLKDYPNCLFHVDATQMIGKVVPCFDNIDLISLSAHKFFGIKGIGILIKKENVVLEPQLDGGKATTVYRSGTPATPLITTLSIALEEAYNNFDKKLKHVTNLNKKLMAFFSCYNDIIINNTNNSINQIINISTKNVKASDLIKRLDENEIYVSSKSACSNTDAISKAVMNLYKDEKRAENSIRISFSYVTSKKDVNRFIKTFDKVYKSLGGK